MRCVDLFAGAGGASDGLAAAGLDPIGCEWDRDACASHHAAGHRTVRCDLTRGVPVARADFVWASPPCTAFSVAGKMHGAGLLDDLCATTVLGLWDAGPAMHDDPNVWLPLVAFGEVDRLRPELLAMEQVPGVLPLWQAFGTVLDSWGYSWWAGVLNAADFGVPQTRRRAILMASRVGVAHPPDPTHAQDPTPGLFGTLAPWVAMAEALGWTDRVGFPRRDENDPTCYRERDWRSCDEPAQHVTEKVRSWVLDRRQNGAPVLDPAKVPSPTLTGMAGAKGVWKVTETWAYDRPATTVANDTRVWPPGHKVNADDRRRHGDADERYGDRAGTDAIRITVRDALILQGFDPDRPLVGSRTSQFRQVGNAVPPPVAAAVARALMKSR